MQIKDLTIDEFRQLIKTCIRETVEEIIDDRLDDDPDTILPELRQTLLQQRDRRQTGQTKTLSAAEALQALDLDDE
jgi:flagellar biosynthesis/type III secretory pathway protein FliH